jgi:hypothetical protein
MSEPIYNLNRNDVERLARLEVLSEKMDEKLDSILKVLEKTDNRVTSLEAAKSKAGGYLLGVSGVSSLFSVYLPGLINKLMH